MVLRNDQGAKFKYQVGRTVKLLENRKETLRVLKKEYTIDSTVSVLCNTQKLEQVTARDLFRLARTAGHFGIFSPCGICCAADIFYIDESLSQI